MIPDIVYQLNLLRNLLKSMEAVGVRYKNVLTLAEQVDPKVKLAVIQLLSKCISHFFNGEKSEFNLDKEIDQIILLADNISNGPEHG